MAREEYQLQQAYDNCRAGIEESIKSDPTIFLGFVRFAKSKLVICRLASERDEICDLFAELILRTYADDV
jgi:hypothetical protein